MISDYVNLTDQATWAIEQTELLDSLRQIGEKTLGGAEDLYEYIVDVVHQLTHSPVAMWRVDEKVRTTARIQAYRGLREEYVHDRVLDLEHSVTGEVIRAAKFIEVVDIQKDPRVSPASKVEASQQGWKSMLVVPLLAVAGRAVGTLSIYSSAQKKFTASEIDLLHIFANQAGTAIQNADSFQTIRLLQQVSAQISTTLELDQVLPLIVKGAMSLTKTESGVVHTIDSSGEKSVNSYGYPDAFGHPSPRISEKGYTRLIVQKKRQQVVEDAQADEQANPQIKEQGVRSFVGTPLKLAGERVVGVLYVNDTSVRSFTEKELSLLSTLADQAAIAIDNARLFRELGERASNLARLQKITATISAEPPDIDKVSRLIVDNLDEIFRGASCAIRLYDSKTDTFRSQVGIGIMEDWVDHLPRLDGTSRYIVQNKTARYLEGNALVSPHDGGPAIRKDILALGVKAVAYLPLISEGDVVGILYVNLTAPHRFSLNEKQILELFADQSAIAIKNAWLYEQRAKDIATLQEVNEAITTASRTEIIGLIAQKARELTQAEYIGVWTVEGDRLIPGAMYGLKLMEIPELPIDEHSINGWVAMRGKPYKCVDVERDPHYRMWQEDVLSSVAFPLKFAGQVIGTLGAESTERNAFSDYQLELLQSLADQAAIAIENARLYEQRSNDIAALQEINEAVVSKTPSEILDLIVQKAVEVMPGEHSTLWLKEPDTGDFVLRAVSGPAEEAARKIGRLAAGGESISMRVVQTGEPYICANVEDEPGFYRIYKATQSSVTVPLKYQNKVIGTLNVESSQLGAFTSQHSQLLDSFADQGAIAIENARMYEQRLKDIANLNAVNKVGQTLTSRIALSEGQILELIYEQATPLMDTRDMYIALYEPDPEQPDEYKREKPEQSIIHGTVRFGLAMDEGQRVDTEHEEGWGPRKAGRGLTEVVIRTRQPHLPDDVQAMYDRPDVAEYIGNIPQSWMGVPMMMGDEVLGVVVLRNDENENVYNKDDQEVLQTIATQSAIALQNARLVQQLEQRVRELDTLQELAEEFDIGTLPDVM